MSTSLLDTYPVQSGFAGIADLLRRAIASGELPRHAQLPAISELARRYGTTAITVRRALRLLEQEGLVRVEHGVGTFVADWAGAHDLLRLPSFSAEMEARELGPRTEVRARGRNVVHPEAAQALGMGEGTPLVMLARLRRLRELPVAFQRSYLPVAFGDLVGAFQPDQSLYEALRQQTGRLPVSSHERLEAVVLPAEIAGELEVVPGSAGWRSLRTTLDPSGVPLVFDEAFLPGERLELQIDRHAGQTRLEFRLKSP